MLASNVLFAARVESAGFQNTQKQGLFYQETEHKKHYRTLNIEVHRTTSLLFWACRTLRLAATCGQDSEFV
jgi:hypothetical protein